MTDVTDAVTGEQIEYRRKFNDIREHAPFVSGSWALDKGPTKSANLNARYSYDHFFLHQRNHVIPTGAPEHDDRLVEDYPTKIFEVGGDVTRPLAGGAIKLRRARQSTATAKRWTNIKRAILAPRGSSAALSS